MLVPEIEIRRPQRVAAVLLLLFAAQCFWAAAHRPLTVNDLHYARCGQNLWQGKSPGSTSESCSRINDGVFAYLAAGLPLELANLVEEGVAEFHSSDEPPASQATVAHPLGLLAASRLNPAVGASILLRLPFIFFGVWLGGGLWWVSRRLYGNEGGFIALAFYCFSPEVLRHCVEANNEILAAWGAYGVVYTGIGLAHAMQGPVRKWRPRLILLAVALGLTAAAHNAAAVLALLFTIGFMLYLAGRRRRLQTLPALGVATAGAFVIVLACYRFNLGALGFGPHGADAFLRVTWSGARQIFCAVPNIGISIAAAVAVAIFLIDRRARYFGNGTPLIAAAILLSLGVAGVGAAPWVWALPFLLTFIGGVFADGLESRFRPMLLPIAGALLVAQAALNVTHLPGVGL